jgi:hypothetical protein
MKSESTMATMGEGSHERHPLKFLKDNPSMKESALLDGPPLWRAEPSKPPGGYHSLRQRINPYARIYMQIKGETTHDSCTLSLRRGIFKMPETPRGLRPAGRRDPAKRRLKSGLPDPISSFTGA